MPWNRPTLEQLAQRISADFSGRLLGGGALLSRSVLRVFSLVWAGACHLMHGFFAWAFLQIFPDSAEAAYLERWSAIWGVTRKPGAVATGAVAVSGAEGVTFAQGVRWRDARGLFYRATADAVVSDGAATVAVEAETPGAGGNLEAGETLQLVSPIAGADMDAASLGLSGGADEEDDESLRTRLLQKIRRPPHGGNADDYVQWALAIPGVTRAWCLPLWQGIGTVGLTFVCDDAPAGPLPDAAMVAAVQAELDRRRPVTAALIVFAPEPLAVDIDVLVTPYSAALAHAIELELADLFVREGAVGETIPLTPISEAISVTPGEFDHVLRAPVADITPATHQLPVPGTVTIGPVS